MKVTPKIKALEVIKFASGLFKDPIEIKTSSIIIVDEVIGSLRSRRNLDWERLRRTGEETSVYWREVKAEIDALPT
jgi:hypothetical protein